MTVFEFREWIESISLWWLIVPIAGILLFMLALQYGSHGMWRYYWRRYLKGVPLQWCNLCGRAYCGGLPQWSFARRRWQWLASYKEFCSRECADLGSR